MNQIDLLYFLEESKQLNREVDDMLQFLCHETVSSNNRKLAYFVDALNEIHNKLLEAQTLLTECYVSKLGNKDIDKACKLFLVQERAFEILELNIWVYNQG